MQLLSVTYVFTLKSWNFIQIVCYYCVIKATWCDGNLLLVKVVKMLAKYDVMYSIM